ncbi:MAG: hypothetical protein Q9225_006896, partial [Loekoesia sp. 1 TL-2023]
MQEKPKMQNQRSRPIASKFAQGVPRDAQLNNETTRDFADFIRSTGPEERPGLNQRDGAASPPSSKSRPNKAMIPSQRSISAISAGKKITKPNPGLSKSPPPVASDLPPKRTISKLQAREATYEPTHNEDLLDFLKQGPLDDRGYEKRPLPGPVASVIPQNPQVANNLRPRTSDNTRSSVASTQDSSFADKSIRSTNSRTGLLDSPRRPHGGSLSPASPRPSRFEEALQPARKQRRVKDPYAVDIDSANDDDNHPGTPKPQRQAESLIDFLNSTPPPGLDNPRIPSAFDDMPNPSLRKNKTNGNTTMKNASTTRAAATPGIRSAT